MLVKTLPVYCRWQDEMPVKDYLQTLKEQMLGSMSNDIYSFAELCTANSSVSSKILFAYQGDLPSAGTVGGAPYENVPLLENATGEMLTVQLFRDGQKMILTAEFHANLYSSGFIARMMQCYAKVLSGLMKEERLNQVALLPEEQLDELDAFNRTGSEYDSSQSVGQPLPPSGGCSP